MDHLTQDLRYAVRALAARPTFTLVVVVTLGLGIGVNSAVFSVINALLLRPLPVANADELVSVYAVREGRAAHQALSYPEFEDLTAQEGVFTDVFGHAGLMAAVTGDEGSAVVFGELVTANYFGALGVVPVRGRGFLSDEDQPGAPPVAVISHNLWRSRYAEDPNVIGREITINGARATIVGVTPSGFHGLIAPFFALDVWVPLSMADVVRGDQLDNRVDRWMFAKARLGSGVDVDVARAAVAALGGRLAEAYPETNENVRLVTLLTEDITVHPDADDGAGLGGVFLMSTVALVLLIACMNVANLVLARAAARRREIAVRLALGARTRRLVGQLLTESLLLGGAGGLVGLMLALWVSRLIVAFNPPFPVRVSLDVSPDGRVLAFTALLAIVSAVTVGLVPALQASRPSVVADLRGSDSATRRGRTRRNLLVVPQVAGSLVLLVLAGLFLRSVTKANTIDLGFDVERTIVVSVDMSRQSGYDEVRARAFWETVSERVERIPAISVAAVTNSIPLGAFLFSNPTMEAEIDDRTEQLRAGIVGVGYFRTFDIPVRGRVFTATDETGPRVAVLSAAAAELLWPGEEAIGRTFRVGEDAMYEVIGVAADAKVETLDEVPQPFVYVLQRDRFAEMNHVVARVDGSLSAGVTAVRRVIAELDSDIAIFQAIPMEEHVALQLYPYRMAAAGSAVLGLLGLTIAAVGLYGVVSYSVSRRVREMGIRIALGARGPDVVRLVMREGLGLVGVGVIIGVTIALLTTRLMGSVLFGVSGVDPVTYLTIPALLAGIAAVATFVPARRATRVDPVGVLRAE